MKSLPAIACLALTLPLLAACGAPVPQATNYPMSEQHPMQAAHHWRLLAHDVAQNLAKALPPAASGPVRIEYLQPPSSFATGFQDMLITELHRAGYVIDPLTAPTTVAFRSQVVRHKGREKPIVPMESRFLSLGGGTIGYGIYRLLNGAPNSVGIGAGVVGAGAYATASWIGDNTNTEVIVTTTVDRKGEIFHRQSDVYYINDTDGANYGEPEKVVPIADQFVVFVGGPLDSPSMRDADDVARDFCLGKGKVAKFRNRTNMGDWGQLWYECLRMPER
ncbi:MAG: hypothetical protein HQL41_00365 [Alphaproteobacteria bacterium]|nr:hypothetical protein [Alphaproteobacteria bacterium]